MSYIYIRIKVTIEKQVVPLILHLVRVSVSLDKALKGSKIFHYPFISTLGYVDMLSYVCVLKNSALIMQIIYMRSFRITAPELGFFDPKWTHYFKPPIAQKV